MNGACRNVLLAAAGIVMLAGSMPAQRGGPLTPKQIDSLRAHRNDIEKQLEDLAVIDRKLMIPMRDGVRMQADVYHPKNVAKAPTIFVRTPYLFNWWDIQLGAPRDLTAELDAVKRGYAYVEIDERGHFYSEGNYDILGPPLTDGYDEIKWISS